MQAEWQVAGFNNAGEYANAIVNDEVPWSDIALNEYFSSEEGQAAYLANELTKQYRDYDNAWSANQAEIQRNWSAAEAEKNRLFNMAEAAKQREWTEMMSNSAHVREVKDLLAAGLNPVLSVMGGNGAPVGSASAASGVQPSGSSANGNQSSSMAIASMLGTLFTNQQRMTETLINANLVREENEKSRALSEALGYLNQDTALGVAGLAAGASMYGSDLQYDYNIKKLNVDERQNMRNASETKRHNQALEAVEQQKLTNSLIIAGVDAETALEVARMYTETTKEEGAENRKVTSSEGSKNRGSKLISDILHMAASGYGAIVQAASG